VALRQDNRPILIIASFMRTPTYLLTFWLTMLCLTPQAWALDSVLLTAAAQPVQRAVPRIGLNLGGSSTWGADQLINNVLKNPGFEAPLDRTLVIAKDIGRNTVTDDNPWLARPDGFWDGARFDVRTGTAAGSGGLVLESTSVDKNSPTRFYLDPFPAGLASGDAFSVSIMRASNQVPMWWSSGGRVSTSTAQVRPGSPGLQSAHLVAGAGGRSQLTHYLDMIGNRAGKLLLVNGEWTLSVWARSNTPRQTLQLRFQRQGTPAFVQESVTLGREWKLYTFGFRAHEQPQEAPAPPLELSFGIDGGDAWLDDATLGRSQSGAGGFRREVVEMLKQLKPGYLRDWQGQLGDSIANRLAEPFARHPTRYRPGESDGLYLYSLPEFFKLCAAVGAQPWVVAPTLSTDAEWLVLGAWLKQAATRYGMTEIVVEFGNENWNAIFRPGGFMSPQTHAEAADRAFRLLKTGAAGFKGLRLVVNAQFVNPDNVMHIARASREADSIAVAPYFLYSLPATTPVLAVAAAFADDDKLIRLDVEQAKKYGKQLMVYEVNFHTTEGDAGTALRNIAVTDAHSGAALARSLLQTLQAGVREQMVYVLAAFDSKASGERGLVRLWGIARDLAPGQLRPTGLALQLLNEAVGGDAHVAQCAGATPACKQMTAVFFQQTGISRLAVASASAATMTIRTSLPCNRKVQLRLLDGSVAGANNETDVQVALRSAAASCGASGWQFDLPAYSVAVLAQQPSGAARP
jgi:hypothetical protein